MELDRVFMVGITGFLMGLIIDRSGRQGWSSGKTFVYAFLSSFFVFFVSSFLSKPGIDFYRIFLFSVGVGLFGGFVGVVFSNLLKRSLKKKIDARKGGGNG